MFGLRSLVLVAILGLATRAAALDIPAGESIGLKSGATPGVIHLSGTLLLHTRTNKHVAVTAVHVDSHTAAIDVQGPPGTITLGGPIAFSDEAVLSITGDKACRLALPEVGLQPDSQNGWLSAEGPGVDIGTLTGLSRLGGTGTNGTVRTIGAISGSLLEKYGVGTWTITGDNRTQAWGVTIGDGRIVLAPGASLGSNSVSVSENAVVSLPAGGRLPAHLTLNRRATLDLTDGMIGETEISYLQAPVNEEFIIRLDISSAGVDHIRLGNSGGNSGGRIAFNQVGPKLKPGTYTFISSDAPDACLLEQHCGFDFTGGFENHYNIVYTERLGQYDLTVRPVFVRNWPAMTVTVTPATAGKHRPPLALPLPGERGPEVKTAMNTPTEITLAGVAYAGTIVSYAHGQPAHGKVHVAKDQTGSYSGTDLPPKETYKVVTYTPAPNYVGTDSFLFTVVDSDGASSAPATIYIGVGDNVNLPPMARPLLRVMAARNTATPITLTAVDYGLLADGTIASYEYSQPAHGSVIGTGPDVTYTPAPNYRGRDHFTFKVTDDEGATSTPALVFLIVGGAAEAR